MKKSSIIHFCALLCAVLFSSCIQSGKTGDLRWSIVNGTLTISGTGTMPDYDYPDIPSPWFLYRDSIFTVIIKEGISNIGDFAFTDCRGLTSVTIPSSVVTIGIGAFIDCVGLTSVTIPSSVTTIKFSAFGNCIGLTSVTIPNSVVTIGDGVFGNCISLNSVIISNSVTTIGDGVFYNCISLTEIINHATIPQKIYTNLFSDEDKTRCTLRVPATSASAYRTAIGWKDFENIEAITNN